MRIPYTALGQSFASDAQGRSQLSARVLRGDEEMIGLRVEWDWLFKTSGCDNAFLSFAWMSEWWLHFGRRHQLFVVTVRNSDGQLVALAPLYICFWSRLMRIRRLGLLGDRFVGSDYLDVLVDTNYSNEAARCLAEFLLAHNAEWDFADFSDTMSASHVSTALRAQLQERNLNCETALSSVCPYIALPQTAEAYIASLSPKIRKNLNYKLRALERLGEVSFITTTQRPEIEDAFEELLRLHRARADVRGQASAFTEIGVTPFHKAALKAMSEASLACVHLLQLSGKAIAAVYTLRAGKKVSFYQAGMNPEYARCSVGSLLIRFAIEEAIRSGDSEFDFLRGEEMYKAQWVNRSRQMQCVQIFDDRLNSRLARAGGILRQSLRNLKSAMARVDRQASSQRRDGRSFAARANANQSSKL